MKRKIMALLLIFSMMCNMLLPGGTLLVASADENKLICEQEEHSHGDDCYTYGEEIICGLEEFAGHTHGDECYNLIALEQPACGLEEFDGHAHGVACYEAKTELTCGLEESAGHAHGDDCYAWSQKIICENTEEGHKHDDSCYEDVQGELTCTEEETEGHQHGEDCYTVTETLICKEAEVEGHKHDDACLYDKQLSCTEEESEGHSHSNACRTATLVCDITEHIHSEECYEQADASEPVIPEEPAEPTEPGVGGGVGETTGGGTDVVEKVCTCEATDEEKAAEGFAHAEGCDFYVAPVVETPEPEVCATCGNATCTCTPVVEKVCTCEASEEEKAAEGFVHAEGCPLYVAPVAEQICTCETAPDADCPVHPSCPECGVKDGELHLKGCVKYVPVCTCKTETAFHAEGCDLYLAPVTAEVYTEEDGVYTKIDGHGENEPIDVEDYNGKTVYILASDEPQNLYFEHNTWGNLFGVKFSINDETYARLDDTDNSTFWGSGKALVTIAGGAPVESEIILVADTNQWKKRTVTIKVVEEIPIEEQETAMDDFELTVEGLPDGVELELSNAFNDDYHKDLEQYIDSDSELLYVFDITPLNSDGTPWQPESGQPVTVTVDFKGMGLPDGNTLKILHEHNGELKELGEYVIEDGKLTFSTDGFSKFYFYITYTFGGHSFTMSGGSTVYLSEILQTLGISYDVSDVESVEFTNPDVLKITWIDSDWELESLAPFGTEETLTVIFNDGETIEITVKDPVIYNYAVGNNITNVTLLGTAQRTVKNVNNGDVTAQGKTYYVNTEQITVENVKAAGVAENTSGKHPAPGAKHMIIYATEGMAIDFIGGTDWTYEGSTPTAAENEIWFWAWESSVSANYVIVKDGTAGQQATFTVTTTVDDTKYYCNVVLCVVYNSKPTLLSDFILLSDDLSAEYSIKNVPVTLYNYDGKLFNEYYNGNSDNYFAFSGTSMGKNSTENAENRGWTSSGLQANGGGSVALMGIMEDELDEDGLPVTSQGQKVDLFSSDTLKGAKDVYENVGFQFIYNEKTGYYSYNSALNHAQYNEKTNEIELYKQSLAPSDTPNGDSHGNAGFYPFEDINKAYTNTGYTEMDTDTWKEKLKNNNFELIPSQYSTDIVTTSADNSTADMHYGLQVKSDFYLPEKKKLNGEDMIYEFTGDDDLWVYIDGQLVLDIGGGHTYVSGSFNLTTGEVWVEKYTKLAAADGGSYDTRVQGTDLGYTDSFLTSLEDDQMHTIQIFYLERHGGVSNCRMHFNLPLAPMNAVEVSKNVVNQNGEPLSVTPDVEYTFQIFTADGDNDEVDADADNFEPLANKSFFGGKTTNEKGEFKLKAGETAKFEGIPRFTEVYVIESTPNKEYVYTNSMVSVNGDEAVQYKFGEKTDTNIVKNNEPMSFEFTNYMQTQPLTIEKQVVNGTAGLIDPTQKFEFVLDFTKNIVEKGESAIHATNQKNEAVALTNGDKFMLGHGESVTIPKVPVNMTFTLKEANPDSENGSFDAPKFESTICTTTETPNAFDENYTWTMGDNGENKIVVTNQQRFNLTISKTGIQDVDHDNDEQQSTIYTIVGKIDDTVIVEMDVAICGNNSVTVHKLPVGSYTVEENANWSWRYVPQDGVEKNVTIQQYATAVVDYVNVRNKEYCLSGDCYAENWWSINGLKRRNGSNEVIY